MSDFEESGPDYYAILNVSRDASQDEVTKAYRKLAFVFHPDKHPNQDLKDGAQEAFGKLQEAYEVLGDEQKRQIYDIYGKQGLNAGFELGERLKSREELKKEWEDFKKKQELDKTENSTVIKGQYQCKIDVTDLKRKGLLVRSISVTNSADAAVGKDGDVMLVQGQASVRNQVGTGGIIFGYTRQLSSTDTLGGLVILGMSPVGTLTSTRQLDVHTTASTVLSWSPSDGLGMEVRTTRQLPYGCSGAHSWVLGPQAAAGMSLQINCRGTTTALHGKLDIGAVTSISARVTMMVNNNLSIKAMARLGTSGIDLEVGASNRFSDQVSGYLGTQVGLMGVVVKTRVVRLNQTVEIPILVSSHWDDWGALVLASVGPPILYLAASRYAVRPFLAWRRRVAEGVARKVHAEEVGVMLRAAGSERVLLAPVAARKAKAEASRLVARTAAAAAASSGGGLLILEAVYGVISEYRASLTQQQQQQIAQTADEREVISSSRVEKEASKSSDPTQTQSPPPASWVNVTEALQYLVVDSKLVLHPGVSKAGLMAFCDPAPHAASKQLYVAYLDGVSHTVREALVEDMAGVVLPPVLLKDSTNPTASVNSTVPSVQPTAASRRTVGCFADHGLDLEDASTIGSRDAWSREASSPGHAVVTDEAKRKELIRRGAVSHGLDEKSLLAVVE
ncbi:hypothetical protein CEUSTIGMA_g10343.t1 [Chlamydomonas eustigma]|uniref:J domain-containing protein n=1 Tax=Chlamydomonas eustigma TaxID=1157962 RepID=A0A250XIJ7_9CHLO|nr:hypothetical protein CEUSTIGMA_g10343.t1 [Chlamydomonas eustigma]|eukprot:GAX82917.1 hypothetical protein CEUSTIGMA_g10343.t1 [Chlamydomonas eustigma]